MRVEDIGPAIYVLARDFVLLGSVYHRLESAYYTCVLNANLPSMLLALYPDLCFLTFWKTLAYFFFLEIPVVPQPDRCKNLTILDSRVFLE